MIDLTVGARIFNHGDMANCPYFATITQVRNSEWGSFITVRPDGEEETHTIATYTVGDVYKGNGLTRIVTEAAYLAWHAAQLARITARREVA